MARNEVRHFAWVIVALVAAAGCAGGRRGGGGSGRDAGPRPATIETDGGRLPTGRDAGPFGAVDAGGSRCGRHVYPAPPTSSLASCSPALTACIARGGSAACFEPEPDDCFVCNDAAFARCATLNGCDDESGAFECCQDEACGDDAACRRDAHLGPCGDELEALQACAQATISAGACHWPVAECLPEAGPAPRGCAGTAWSTGTVDGMPVPVRYAVAHDDRGGLGVFLTNVPYADVAEGGLAIVTRLTPIEGQRSYAPASGLFQCGIVQRAGSSWRAVSSGLCELEVETLRYASARGVCDGSFVGAFRALFGAADVLGGTFDVPLPVSRAEIAAPSCRPRGASCSSHGDCCSESCFIAVGECN